MESNVITDHQVLSSDCDEVRLLKKQLAENEEKLVKFKKFVINLKNERTQLQQKVVENGTENEKLKVELAKFQSKSYQQIFQNFQNLQAEYDKIQDVVEIQNKNNKTLESDLIKCGLELSNFRETCANQKEEIIQLQNHSNQQQSQIETLQICKKELESKIIVLQTECREERRKNGEFQECDNERRNFKEELNQKNNEVVTLVQSLEEASLRITALENEVTDKGSLLIQLEDLQIEKQHMSEENNKKYETIGIQREQIDKLNKEIQNLNSQNELKVKQIADLQLGHSQKVSGLELLVRELQDKLQLNEGDLALSKTKFDEYKQRVSSVLKDGKLNNLCNSKDIEDLNSKNEILQEENKTLRFKLNNSVDELEKIKLENAEFKAKISTIESELKEIENLKSRIQLLTNDNLRLTNSIEHLKMSFTKEKQIILDQNMATVESLRIKYEAKIKELEDEMINFRNVSDDSNSLGNSNTSFEEIKEENLSYHSNNSNSERNFLEEILNFDTCSKSSDLLNSSNIDNLTQLLSESENSITLLSEQNRLLKEEIRRLQRSVDRMDIANNLEYLKNVLLKFLTIKGVDERERLITVLTTILKLTSEERDVFHQCLQDNGGPNANSKWSLWQWS